jgi:hypothetical protein
MTLQEYDTTPLDDPARWGLSHAAVLCLGDQLHQTWTRFQGCFKTKTRDASTYDWVALNEQHCRQPQRNVMPLIGAKLVKKRLFLLI